MLTVLFGAVPCSQAQEPLRWKFEPGQKLNYNMVQDMTMSLRAPVGEQSVSMNQEMEMTWQVAQINAVGDAVIHQTFDRMKVKMTLPPALGGVVEFDSSSDVAPSSQAAQLASLYKTLSDAQFEFTMTPRGEIKDVKVPENVITALKNISGGILGDVATPEGFKKMISNGALVLPENPPQPGDQWSTRLELNAPLGGKQIVETTYRFEGIKELDGASYAVFHPNISMHFSPEIITLEGTGTEKSPVFILPNGQGKIKYSYEADAGANAGEFSVFVVEDGKDVDMETTSPAVTTQALQEQSETTLLKTPGRYFLQVLGDGKWKVAVETTQQMTVKEQNSSGEIMFNVEQGRLHSSSLDQKVTSQSGGLESTIDQKIRVTVTPADGAAGNADFESQK